MCKCNPIIRSIYCGKDLCVWPEVAANQDIKDVLNHLANRIDLLESVFKKICEFDSRLDTLEFNSNLPVKPSISEMLLDLRLRVEKLETT